MKKIIAINAGPRKGWNTDQLIKAAAEGAAENGAVIVYYDLYKLSNVKGCISCFGCKTEKSYGKCAYKDDLTEILEQIREADGLIIGSPNYLSNMTAGFRAIYERLVFQVLTYNKDQMCCNDHKIPVILIMTSNCPEEFYGANGYEQLLAGYKQTLDTFVGSTTVLCCGNTLQVNDYNKYNWTMFDPEAKKAHHDETFNTYLTQAHELGKKL